MIAEIIIAYSIFLFLTRFIFIIQTEETIKKATKSVPIFRFWNLLMIGYVSLVMIYVQGYIT